MYSYADYLEAYYHGRVYDCKKIGCYLLEKRKDKRSKKLLKKLSKLEYDWKYPEWKLRRITKLLSDVKIWLMVSFY